LHLLNSRQFLDKKFAITEKMLIFAAEI
jgi:hypothetical protein